MPSEEDMSEGWFSPRTVLQLGVGAVIGIYLVYKLSLSLPEILDAVKADAANNVQANQTMNSQLTALKLSLDTLIRTSRGTCLNTASSDTQRQNCL